MSSKRILVVMMAILALTASLAFAQGKTAAKKSDATAKKSDAAPAKDAETKAPRLTVVEPVKDYGTIPKGEKLSWVFAVKLPRNCP